MYEAKLNSLLLATLVLGKRGEKLISLSLPENVIEMCLNNAHICIHTVIYGCLLAAYWNNTQCNNVCDIAVIALQCSCYIGRKLWISIRDLLYMNNLKNNNNSNNNGSWTNSECQTFRVRMRLCHGSRQRSLYRAV